MGCVSVSGLQGCGLSPLLPHRLPEQAVRTHGLPLPRAEAPSVPGAVGLVSPATSGRACLTLSPSLQAPPSSGTLGLNVRNKRQNFSFLK